MSLETRIPKGSRVLVTGANGFLASHVVKAILSQGYKVRGTVRSLEQSAWLLKDVFPTEIKNGDVEIVAVADMNHQGAFNDAIKGVAGVVHIATITTIDPDPEKIVPGTVSGVLNILKAAAKESSVKVFVYTSSIVASFLPSTETPFTVDRTSWNETAVSLAYAPPPYTPERGMIAYMASKTKAEQALWKFVEEEKPAFTVNSVLPYTILGPLVHKEQKPSTDAWLFYLFDDEASQLNEIQGMAHVDVRDVAAIHVAAVLDTSVNSARLYAWSTAFNWNDVAKFIKEAKPDAKLATGVEETGRLQGTFDDAEEKRLLKRWAGQDFWTSLQTTVRDTIAGPWPVNKGVF